MRRKVIYEHHTLRVEDDSISPLDIRASMAEVFPELRDAVILEDGYEIHLVPKQTMRQNYMDIHFNTAFLPSSREEKEMSVESLSARISPTTQWHMLDGVWVKEEDALVTIRGEYATKGGYEHLVGTKALLLESYDDLSVCLVRARKDNKEYVIRTKDLLKNKTQEEWPF